MGDVPDNPAAFFTEYLPSRFDQMKSAVLGKSSIGSMLFRVSGASEWSLRLADGALRVDAGTRDDVLLQVDLAEADFGPILVQGAREHEHLGADPGKQVMAFRALLLDAAQAELVRNVKGSVAFVVTDGDKKHQITITPGAQKPNVAAPECRLECRMTDFMDMQAGKVQPIQLAMSGQIKIIGNAQIPMALSAVFV